MGVIEGLRVVRVERHTTTTPPPFVTQGLSRSPARSLPRPWLTIIIFLLQPKDATCSAFFPLPLHCTTSGPAGTLPTPTFLACCLVQVRIAATGTTSSWLLDRIEVTPPPDTQQQQQQGQGQGVEGEGGSAAAAHVAVKPCVFSHNAWVYPEAEVTLSKLLQTTEYQVKVETSQVRGQGGRTGTETGATGQKGLEVEGRVCEVASLSATSTPTC